MAVDPGVLVNAPVADGVPSRELGAATRSARQRSAASSATAAAAARSSAAFASASLLIRYKDSNHIEKKLRHIYLCIC